MIIQERGGKLRNIKMIIEYDGSRYDGWQLGPKFDNKQTIKNKIESVLQLMENEKIELVCASRTEAGVHAYGQVANFTTNTTMKPWQIKQYLNRYLPQDIAVIEVDDVPDRFNSSFSAKSIIYEYKISTADVPNVFERKYNYYCFDKLDTKNMQKAANFLLGKHDLKAFSDNPRLKKSTVRNIYELTVYGSRDEVLIMIHADDFWPNMARIIAGTLIEVGRGNISVSDMESIIASCDRSKAGPTAEARGLFLSEVRYAAQ